MYALQSVFLQTTGKEVKDAQQWNDDITLFLFGYLVRRFWERVITKEMYEEEIWVTSHFTMNLNVIHRIER